LRSLVAILGNATSNLQALYIFIRPVFYLVDRSLPTECHHEVAEINSKLDFPKLTVVRLGFDCLVEAPLHFIG
jgi:hypothetical protein